MAAVATALMRLVLGDAGTVRTEAARTAELNNGDILVTLAAAWRVVPELRKQLASAVATLDGPAQSALHAHHVAAAAQSAAIAHRGGAALTRLHDAGVDAVAFKGIGLIAALYRNPSLRMVQDIDILISEPDLEPTLHTLAGAGFEPITEQLDEYVDYLERRPHEGASSGTRSLVLRDADACEIDLHWRLAANPPAALTADAIIDRAERATLYRHSILVAAPADAMMLTVHHIVRASFAPMSTLKDLCDLRAWWQVQPERWEIDAVIDHARACGLSAPLLGLWQTLAQLDAGSAATAGVRRMTERVASDDRRAAQRLGEALHMQLQHGRINMDLLRLLSPTAAWRFVTRRLRDPGTTEHFTRQMEVEFDLPPRRSDSERFWSLLHELRHLSPRRLAAYRALLRAHALRPPP